MLWLAAFVVLLVGEIISVALTSIWFAAGALAAFVLSLFCDILWVQILVFLLVSLVLLIFTKPFAEKYINRDREKTNVDAIVGRQGVITQQVNNLEASGEVSIAGQIWMARAVNDGVLIPEGTKVIVKEVRGVKLIVETEQEKEA